MSTEILPSSATFSLSHRPHLLSPAACRSLALDLGAEALGPREQQKGVCVYKKNGFIQLNSLSRHEVAILLLIRSHVDGECWEFGMWG